jgi:hypothetical protein
MSKLGNNRPQAGAADETVCPTDEKHSTRFGGARAVSLATSDLDTLAKF